MNFEESLQKLDFLSGSLETMQEFNNFYEILLNEVKERKDISQAAAMRKLSTKQVIFLIELLGVAARIEAKKN
jgi:hypothetical protein